MKSLALFPLLLLLPAAASAQEGAIDLGLAAGVYVPDDLEVMGTAPTFSPRIGYWPNETMLVEADLGFSTGNTSIGTPDPFPFLSLTPRINMIGRVWPDQAVNVLFVAGLGAWYKKINDEGELQLPQGDGADLDFLGNAGPGLMVPIGDSLAFRSDVRWMLSLGGENWQNRGDAFMNWEWTAGLALMIGGTKDTDKDGIADDVDECINEMEDMDAFQDEDGCPDLDNDEDGIVDADDLQCPNDAEDMDQFEDEDGCPDPDNDEDGVLDVDEEPDCINLTGVASANGCPDADGDGLRDRLDECETDAADETDVANAFGCPDGDDDGIPDYRDQCKEEAGPEDAHPFFSNGCVGRAYPVVGGIKLAEPVAFSGTRIRSSSNKVIDDVSEIIKALPQFKKLEVQVMSEGADDDEGATKTAQTRSERIVKVIVDDGVDEERISAATSKMVEAEGDEEVLNVFVAATEAEEIKGLKKPADEKKKTAPREAPKDEGADEDKKTAPREAPAKEEGADAKAAEGDKKTATREAPAKEEAAEGDKKTAPREAPAKEDGDKAE